MTLTFTVDKQSITRTDTQQVVANSISYLRAQFAFLNDWDTDHILTPLFQNGTRVYTPVLQNGRYLDEDNTCVIPQEVLAETGTLYVSIIDETDGVRITTDRAAVPIERSGYTPEAEETLTPTPSAYEQILTDYADFKQTGLKATDTDLTLEDGKLHLTANGEAVGTGVALPKTVTVSEFAPTEIAAITDGETFAGWGVLAGTYDGTTFTPSGRYTDLPPVLQFTGSAASAAAYNVSMAVRTEVEGIQMVLERSLLAQLVGDMSTANNTVTQTEGQYVLLQNDTGGYNVYLYAGILISGLSSTAKEIAAEFHAVMQQVVSGARKAGVSFVLLEEEDEAI